MEHEQDRSMPHEILSQNVSQKQELCCSALPTPIFKLLAFWFHDLDYRLWKMQQKPLPFPAQVSTASEEM